MQFAQLEHTLEQRYSVTCLTWIEDLECQASSTLYRRWAPHLAPEYTPDQRFVLLNFRPVGQAVLAHVSWLIQYLDISPSFVLVVTNQPNTAAWFNQQSNPVTVDLVKHVIPHFLPIRRVQPQFNTNNQMCAHAWTGLHVWPNGQVGPCCEYYSTVPDINIRSHSMEQALSSPYMQDLRQQFRSGTWPAGCVACEKSQAHGGESKKDLAPFKLRNIYAGIDWESEPTSMQFVGGHLGNLCNLRCRICSPVFSSSIAAEQIQHSDDAMKNNPVRGLLADNRWHGNSEAFWQALRDRAHTACNFEFLGGEPLLLKENLEFMQWLIDAGHSSRAIFEFVTNGTQYPEIFDQADRFQRLTVTISIDDIEDRFELQRAGASWSQVSQNLGRFVAARDRQTNLSIGACITVNIQNVLYLPQLLTWLDQQGIDHYYFNILHDPDYLSIDHLTPTAQQLVLDRLTSSSVPDPERLAPVIQRVRQSPTSDGQQFRAKMQELDAVRKQSFVLTHQEIAKAMGFVLQSQDD